MFDTLTEDALVLPPELPIVQRGVLRSTMLGSTVYLIVQSHNNEFVGIAQFGGRLDGNTLHFSSYAVHVETGDTPAEVFAGMRQRYLE